MSFPSFVAKMRMAFRAGQLAAFALLVFSSARAETLTLEDCLRETALNNPTVTGQARDVERAVGMRLTYRSHILPTLLLSGIVGYQSSEDDADLIIPGSKDASGNKSPAVRVVQTRGPQFIAIGSEALYQPVFDVSIPANWRRGNIEVVTAQENYYSVAVTQLYHTRLQFYQAVYQHDNGELLAGIDRSFEANIKSAEALVNAGLSPRQALLQAQIQRALFAPAINATASLYRQALAALLANMGREQSATGSSDLVAHIHLQGALDEAVLPFDARAAAREALANRPDLELLRSIVRGLKEDARIVRANYYPKVQLYVTGDLIPDSFTRSDRPNALREGDSVRTTEIRPGGRYDWNVVDTGLIRGAGQFLDRTREQTEFSLRGLEDSVTRDLARIRATLDKDAATLGNTRENSTVAQDTLNIIADTVAKGTGTQQDFINAQNGLLTARSAQLGARFDATAARAEYDFVTGRYIRFVSDGKPATRSARDARPVK